MRGLRGEKGFWLSRNERERASTRRTLRTQKGKGGLAYGLFPSCSLVFQKVIPVKNGRARFLQYFISVETVPKVVVKAANSGQAFGTFIFSTHLKHTQMAFARWGIVEKKVSIRKKTNPIPQEFSDYEEAAEFWDSHDTTEYLQDSRPVKVVSEFRGRHYEIEIDENVALALRKAARQKGITPSRLASDLLRQRLTPPS